MSARKQQNRVVFGAALLIFGVLALLDNLNIFSHLNFLHFWPTLFILVGILKMSRSNTISGQLIGGGFVAWGAILTLKYMGIISFDMRHIWPMLLILGGLAIIFKDKLISETQWGGVGEGTGQSDVCNVSAVMSGANVQNSAVNFRGGELTAVMGGIELDLRGAQLQQDATLNVFAMWGGISIKVPQDWTVMSQGVPLLGGIDDKTVPPAMPGKRLVIQGYAIMGGVEIKN
jgi:predicted membrane protein